MPEVVIEKHTILKRSKTRYISFKHTDELLLRIPRGYEWMLFPHDRLDDYCVLRMQKSGESHD